MTSIFEALPQFMPYHTSIFSLGILCMAVLIQALLTAPLAFLKEEQTPGMPLHGNHDTFSFRVLRTHVNSVENLPTFGLILFLAIIAGAAPTLVNWLAIIHIAFRLGFWFVYYSGVGKVAGGPRTMGYAGGLISNIILTVEPSTHSPAICKAHCQVVSRT